MEGRLDSEAVGVQKAQKWLAKYQAPPIDAALDEALLDFIARRSREIPRASCEFHKRCLHRAMIISRT